MDLDCLGSIVLALYLFPGYVPVRSRLIHPVARNLYNIFRDFLDFTPSRELKGQTIEKMIVMDTRSFAKVKEYFDLIEEPWPEEVIVFDHHAQDTSDIPGVIMNESTYGSNTTAMVMELIKRHMPIAPEAATVALTGLYADTGNFTHENVTSQDFEAAAWLLSQGANVGMVKNFLKSLTEDIHVDLFHNFLNRLEHHNIQGHSINLCYFELDSQIPGVASVVDKVFEVESPDAFFCVVGFRKQNKTLVIGRSQTDSIDVSSIVSYWNGAGHKLAASALIKKSFGNHLYEELILHLNASLQKAVNAFNLMTFPVNCVNPGWTVMEASIFLENNLHTGCPVVDEQNQLLGLITIRDISKARKADNMKAPVNAYMTRKVFSCKPTSSIREIEKILFVNNIGHLPVIDEENRVTGILTRSDYLTHIEHVNGFLTYNPL